MIYIFIIITVIAIVLYLSNAILTVSTHKITSSKLSHPVRIAHISDFHNTRITLLVNAILQELRKRQPDFICITGDLVDSRHTDIPQAVEFVSKLAEIAPVYYVTGNHEIRSSRHDEIMAALYRSSMTVIEDEAYQINGINLIGLNDFYGIPYSQRASLFTQKYQALKSDQLFNVVMFHRPEMLDAYSENGADLVLSGHAHGGQMRFLVVGAGYAPDQGFRPQLAEGLHQKGNTCLIISRGIGNSLFPFRLNNQPELIFIDLKPEKQVEEKGNRKL